MNYLPFTSRPDFGFWLSFEDPNDLATTPKYIDFTSSLRAAGALSRGAQYELGQTLAADPTVILRDVQEYLNSNNPTSPYFGLVDSYRRVLWMGTWPNTPIGNLFNPNYWGTPGTVDANLGPRDPSFESYATGSTVFWLTSQGGTAGVVTTVNPHTGTKAFAYTVVGSATGQGVTFGMRCMPGRYYTTSLWLRQTSASTQSITAAGIVGTTTTTTGAYVRLSVTFLATQPEVVCALTTTGTAIAGTVTVDDVQMEQQPALNRTSTGDSNISMQQGAAGWTPHGCTPARSNLHAYQPEYSLQMTPDGVSTTPFFESDRASTPAVAGQTYIASGWAYAFAGSNIPFLADIRVNWYNASNVLISNPVGTPVPLTANLWTFITTSFVAPAGTAFVTVLATVVATPPASDVVFWDLVQVVSTTPSTFTTSGPTVYPIMANFAERFEKLWLDNEYTGYVQIPCVDALVPLAATKINTEYTTVVLATKPDYWWTMGQLDATGTQYIEHSGGPPMLQANGPGLPFTGSVSPGAASGVVGDPGSTGATVSGSTVTNQGSNIRSGRLVIPSSGAAWSVTMAFWCTFSDVTNTFGFAALSNKNGNMSAILRQGTFDLHPFSGTVYTPFGGGSDTGTTNLTYADGQAHFFVMTNNLAAGNFTTNLYVDGTLQATRVQSAVTVFGTNTPNFNLNALELSSGNFGYDIGDGVNGVYAHAKIWRRVITATEVSNLYQAGKIAFAGESAGTRTARHYAIGQYPAPYRISTNTTSIMGPPSYVGQIDLGSDTANSAVAEGGHFWVAPDGAPVLESRLDRWLRLSPMWHVGNTSGLVHFAAPSYSVDPQFVYANVQLTRSGGATVIGGSAADIAAATRRYFGRTYTAPGALDLSTDAQAQDLANFTFYTHNQTLQRIAVLTFSPYADLNWAFALGVEVGQRINVNFLTPAANGGAGFTNNEDFFVENVTHDGIDADDATWTTSLLLSPIGGPTPPTLQPFILNSATLGVLDQDILGW